MCIRDRSQLATGTPDGTKFVRDDGTLATPAGGLTNPMTTLDDIIVGGASGTPARLAKGSDGMVLTVDPVTHHLVWATPSAGGSPVTVKDEGTTLTASLTSLDFTGTGVSATNTGGAVTVAVSGGGGSATAEVSAAGRIYAYTSFR